MQLSKMQRKQIRKEKVKEAAREYGHDLQEFDNDSIFNFYQAVALKMGIEVDRKKDNNKFMTAGIDANGYRSYHSYLRFNATHLMAAILDLLDVKSRGGPWNFGDLAALKISALSKGILTEEYGKEWKARVSEKIAETYERHNLPNNYRAIFDDRFQFKVIEGQIMVYFDLATVRFKNDQVIMPSVSIPDTLHDGLIGETLGKAVEGLPWRDLRNARITKIQQMPGIYGGTTSVFNLESELVPVVTD